VDIPPECGLPVSALKRLRRAAVELLLSVMHDHQSHSVKCTSLAALNLLKSRVAASLSTPLLDDRPEPTQAQLVPLCRTFEQLEALIDCRERLGANVFEEVELDWMEFVGLRKAVNRARSAGLKVTIATVRVQQPGEAVFDRRITSLKPDGVLLRHWGGLIHFASLPEESRPILHGDFSLNLTNSLSAHHVASYGLATITAAHDLDSDQLHSLLTAFKPSQVAVTVHHHIPTFHTEHCVYAHSLSDGRDSRSCGRPCDEHRIALRDHKGQSHPVLVDVKCRNTVFNASAQTAATLTHKLLAHGVQRMRVEFVWESAAQTTRVLEAYHGLLQGSLTPPQVLSRLKAHERFGLTTGTMEIHR
jgi:putative protease